MKILFLILGSFLATLVIAPVVIYLALCSSRQKKEEVQGEFEETVNKTADNVKKTAKEILVQRVDMRIWDALITKFGVGNVVRYEPMQAYTEGGDMDIVVTFANGTSGIYRAFLPLCKIRGCEVANMSDDYRKHPEEWLDKKSPIEEILEFVRANTKNGEPFVLVKDKYQKLDVDELIEELMFEELADSIDKTADGLVITKNRIE